MNFLSWIFDWKNHPGRVFYLAVPLATSGFGLMLFVAVARRDWIDLAIVLAGISVLVFHPLIRAVIDSERKRPKPKGRSIPSNPSGGGDGSRVTPASTGNTGAEHEGR